MDAVVSICLGLIFIFGVWAVISRSMLKSAIALAVASAVLAVIMYQLDSIWAAMFELSVCSGLITVIFISAISLSRTDKEELEELYENKKRMAYLPAVLIISGVVLMLVVTSQNFSMPAAVPAVVGDTFREVLWTHRQADLWGQIIVVITGALTVVALFKERE